MTTTKQGLRNLDGPQRNARVVTKDEACIHDYRHNGMMSCIGCLALLSGGEGRPLHDYRCTRCGLAQE